MPGALQNRQISSALGACLPCLLAKSALVVVHYVLMVSYKSDEKQLR